MEELSRRQALIMTAASCAACAVCSIAGAEEPKDPKEGKEGQPPASKAKLPETLNIGKLTEYTKPGFYSKFVDKLIIVANVEDRLVAMSARCTHKGGVLKVISDTKLKCPVHKDEYAEHGQVSAGTHAKRSLDRYSLKADANGEVTIDTRKVFTEKDWDKPEAYIAFPKA